MSMLRSLYCVCFLALFSAPTFADNGKPLSQLIDEHIDARIKAENIVPAPEVDDATLIRRLTLDLVGRIPTSAEVTEYTQSKDVDKRAKLVDRLMASPGFSRYQAYLFEIMLVDRPGQGGLRAYLTTAVKENRPWDVMFREMMAANENDPKLKGVSDFLRTKLNDQDKLTSEVSVVFFGVNVSCAQCHDHPHVKDWTQDHYYGMKSFLSRTYDAGGFVAERSAGLIKFKPNKGPEKKAQMMFLNGSAIPHESTRELTAEEQKKDKEAVDKAKAEKKAPAAPSFSARGKLVEVALQKENVSYFAKSIVNRLWHRYIGWGLVMPLDQMHSENEASHPALLKALAEDMHANKYDMKRLVRGILLSKTYSRSSAYESAAHPSVNTFAVARLKALTPIQLATSLKIAVADPKSFENLKPEEFEKRIEQIESTARGFASLIAMPTENFQIGVNESLLFSNSPRVQQEFLTDTAGTLLSRLNAEKEPEAVVKLLIQSVLGRAAKEEELKKLKAFLESKRDRPADANKQLLWAVLTCSEFRFNY